MATTIVPGAKLKRLNVFDDRSDYVTHYNFCRAFCSFIKSVSYYYLSRLPLTSRRPMGTLAIAVPCTTSTHISQTSIWKLW